MNRRVFLKTSAMVAAATVLTHVPFAPGTSCETLAFHVDDDWVLSRDGQREFPFFDQSGGVQRGYMRYRLMEPHKHLEVGDLIYAEVLDLDKNPVIAGRLS